MSACAAFLLQVLVFVSSRRQTRLTALDLIAYAAADDRPRQFLRVSDEEMEQCLATVKVGPAQRAQRGGLGLGCRPTNRGDCLPSSSLVEIALLGVTRL